MCGPTCSDPDATRCVDVESPVPVEGCVCPDGELVSDNECVPQDECGCIIGNQYIKVHLLIHVISMNEWGFSQCLS